jgi:hypothetical protein
MADTVYEDNNVTVSDDSEPTDVVQNEVFVDKSIKDKVQLRDLNCISLGIDEYSKVSFRRYERRRIAINKDSVVINAWKETTDVDTGAITRVQIAENDTNIDWEPSNTEASWTIASDYLTDPCIIEVQWSWKNGENSKNTRKFSLYYQAKDYLNEYLDLTDSEQLLAISIMNRFWALFDNHYGQGLVNLTEEVQTRFNLDNVARCMNIAVNKINLFANNPTSYGIGYDVKSFPARWYMLLQSQAMIEMVREWIIGYLEQPNLAGISGVAYADRSRYYEKWIQEKQELEADVASMKPAYIRDNYSFTSAAVLVGGGMFGNMSAGIPSNNTYTAIRSGALRSSFLPAPTIVVNTNF